jgi:hypothetical protein
MGAVLYKNDDPRDNLAKATRDELWLFAKSSGLLPAMLDYLKGVYWHPQNGWTPRTEMNQPANQATITKPDMENFLRSRGHNNISVAIRSMGRPTGEYLGPRPVPPAPKIPEPLPDLEKLSIGELRKECKVRNVPLSRRDNMDSMKQKLREKAA